MATSWAHAVSGDWGGAANWSTGAVPGASNNVTIALAGSYTVSISSAQAAHALTMNAADASINDNAALSIASSLTLTAGALAIGAGGDLLGGTLIVGTGGTVSLNGGTLTGVTYKGSLSLGSNAIGTISNGLTLISATGTGTAQIGAAGGYGALMFQDSQTINNATINLGGSSLYGGELVGQDYSNTGSEVLTLGAGLTLNAYQSVNGGADYLGYDHQFTGVQTETLVNDGLINVVSGDLAVEPKVFVNKGTIAVSAGAALSLGGTLSNAGGTLMFGAGGTVALGGGPIVGGTIVDASSGLVYGGGELSGVSCDGTLAIGAGEYAYVANGITLYALSGTGTGTADLGSASGYGALIFQDSQTINNATINLGGSSLYGGELVGQDHSNTGSEVLTLGAGLTLNANQTTNGGADYLGNDAEFTGVHADTVVNDGVIDVSGYLIVGPNSFVNQGTITIGAGATLSLPGSFSNAGGTLVFGAGGAVSLGGGPIVGGTIVDTSPGLNYRTGQLSGVTVDGTLSIGGYNYTYVTNSITLQNLAGTGPGVADLGSASGFGALILLDTQTLDNATINLGGAGSYGGELVGQDYSNTGSEVLTLGRGLTVNAYATVNGGNNYLGYDADFNGIRTETLVNNGAINIVSGGLVIGATQFNNHGTITLSAGAGLSLPGSFSNAGGTLVFGAGGAVSLGGGPIVGGTIIDNSTGLNDRSGDLSGVTYDGTLSIGGYNYTYVTNSITLQNLAGTGPGVADLGSASGFGALILLDTQTLDNATINLGGAGSYGGELVGQDYSNTGSEVLTLGRGLTVNAYATVNGGNNYLGYDADFNGIRTETLVNNGAINVQSGGLVVGATVFTNTGSITLAAGTGIGLSGATNAGSIELGAGAAIGINAGTLVNLGSIIAAGAGGLIEGGPFTNTGTLLVAANASLSEQASFTNLQAGTLTGGTIAVGANALLTLSAGSFLTTLNGAVSLSGTGSVLQVYNTSTGGTAALDSTLQQINAGGDLTILAGRNFVSTANGGTLTDAGTITLAGGSVTAQLLTVSNGTLSGTGTLAGAVAVGGQMTVSGGTITLNSALGGAGTASIAAAATLDLPAGGSLAGTVALAGTLGLLGSTLTASQFSFLGGTVSGAGTLAGALVDSGGLTLAGGPVVLAGALSGAGPLTIAAGGSATLAQAASLSGTTTVLGTLSLAGTSFQSAAVAILGQGVIAGYGTLGGMVSVAGQLQASGGTLSVAALAGLSSGKWSGGDLQANAGAALLLAPKTGITVDAGTITLSGAGSAIEWLNSASALTTLDSNLGSIAAQGTLALLAGRNFTATANAGSFTCAGMLALGGTTFTAARLTLTNNASVTGSGTLAAALVVSGSATLSGGALSVTGAVSGAGTLTVAAAETVTLAGGAASFTGTLSDAGTLLLSGGTLKAAALTLQSGGALVGSGTLSAPATALGLLDANGGTLSVAALSSIANGTLTSGALEADAGAVLQLAANTTLTTLAGSVTLNGAGSTIRAQNTTTKKQVTLDSTLGTVASTGALSLLNSRSFTAAGPVFTDAGLLNLQGGTFTSGTLAIAATGTFLDAGSFAGVLSTQGDVVIADGTVLAPGVGSSLGGLISGAGTLALAGAGNFVLTAGATLAAGLVTIAAGADLLGAGTITAALDGAGTLTAAGGTLVLAGTLAGSGTLLAASGATLVLQDGGGFFGTVGGAGTIDNADSISGSTTGVALAGSAVTLINEAGGEVFGGSLDGALLTGGTVSVTNAGAIGGQLHGLAASGSAVTITNSGLITGYAGAAILASGAGTVSIVNTGVIASYISPTTAAVSLGGAASGTLTNAGTIIGGYFLPNGGAAVQFGAGNDRLIIDPGAVFGGTVRGGGGSNTLELAAAAAAGTLAGLGSAFQGFGSVALDAGAVWTLTGGNSLAAQSAIGLGAGGNLVLAGTLGLANGASLQGPGTLSIAAGGALDAASGGTLLLAGGAAISIAGLIDAASGATIRLSGASLANLAAGTLSLGQFEADAGATLQLTDNAGVTADASALVLSGAGSMIDWLNTSTGSLVTLGQSLGSILAGGSLLLEQGASLVQTAPLADAGLITLAGGTLSATACTVTGSLAGSGSLMGTFSDTGIVQASGGTLSLTGAMTGAGTLALGTDATAVISGSLSGGQIAFLGGGATLQLSQLAGITDVIQGFGTADTIDLLGLAVTSESFASNVLILSGAGGVLGTLHFTGSYAGYQFFTAGDGHGGTNLFLG